MEKSINSDIIRGHIDCIILNTLTNSDKYVNEIIDEISDKSNGEYEIKQATLYSCLKRLEMEKYLKIYFKDVENVGRRRYYTLTDAGKEYIRENLDNWNYSRKIINELLSASVDNQVILPPQEKSAQNNELKAENSVTEPQKPLSTPNNDFVREVDYKSVINDLIASTKVDCDEEQVTINTETNKTVDFSRQYTNNSYNNDVRINTNISNNKINLEDIIKLSNENGLKVRVSSKDKVKDVGYVLVNKLNCAASWLICLIMFVETLVIGLSVDKSANIPNLIFILTACCSLIFPIITTVLYGYRPKKAIQKLAKFSIVFTTTCIIIFNLLLIILAIALLGNVNLSIYNNLMYYIVFPLVLLVNVPLFFIIKYRLLKTFKFYVK